MKQPLQSILACVMAQPGTSPRTVFAKDQDGELHHISLVPVGTPDLTCPGCGLAVIAKPGRGGRVPHFAHKSSEECLQAGETEAHLMAKAAIAEAGGVMLPAFTVSTGGRSRNPLRARWFNFEQIEVEKAEDGFRPDLVGYARHPETGETYRLLIEIHVTNPVSAEKISRVTAAGESAIEIDLSKIKRSLTGPEFVEQILREAPRRWIFHRAADELRRMAYQEHRQEEEKKDRQKAFAIAKEAEREAERRRAKAQPPERIVEGDLNWARKEQRQWELLDMEDLFTGPAEDGIFDVPPLVWRAWVMNILAPWRKTPYALPRADQLDQTSSYLGQKMREKAWVKAPFMGPLKRFLDNRSYPWDPVADSITDYFVKALRGYGLGKTLPGQPPDLSEAAKALKSAWEERQSWGRCVLHLRDRLTEHGVETWLGWSRLQGDASIDDAVGMSRGTTRFSLFHVANMAGEIATGLPRYGKHIEADVYSYTGIELRLPGDTGDDCTQRALDHIRANHMRSWERIYGEWIESEASRLLSVFLNLADLGILRRSEFNDLGLDFLFNARELRARIQQDLPKDAKDPLAAARAGSAKIIASYDELSDQLAFLGELAALRRVAEWQDIILVEGLRSFATEGSQEGFRRAMHSDMRTTLSNGLAELAQTTERWGYGVDFPERALMSRPNWSEGRLIDLAFGGDIPPFRRAMNEIITSRQPPRWVTTARTWPVVAPRNQADYW